MPDRLLFLITLMSMVLGLAISPCSSGCLVCSDSNTCGLCDVYNNLVLSSDSTSCVTNAIANCRFAIQETACLVCKGDFYLASGKCEAVSTPIAGCIKYASSSTCEVCNDKKFLTSGKCENLTAAKKVEQCLQYSNEGCELCASGFPNAAKNQCISWDGIDLNCQFYYKGNTCEECASGVVSYPALKSSDSQVYSQIFEHGVLFGRDKLGTMSQPLCSASDSTSLIKNSFCRDAINISQGCIQCDEKTTFLDFKNQQCSKNPPNAEVVSIHKIENCFSLNLNFDCTVCYNGFFLHVTKKKCIKHTTTVTQCKIMSQTIDSVCVICNDGYFMQNNTCVKRTIEIAECLKLDYFSQNCVKCNAGFSLQSLGTKCLKLPDNCQSELFDGSDLLKCSKCAALYYLFDQKCVQIPAEYQISDCNEYLKVILGF